MADPKDPAAPDDAPRPPRLPVRASIYIEADGTVQFGALFEELLPVAKALGAASDAFAAGPAASAAGAPSPAPAQGAPPLGAEDEPAR